MEVLTKILQQGTEFDTLAETVLADRFEQLVQLVTMISDKGELPIAMALANVVTTAQMVRKSSCLNLKPSTYIIQRGFRGFPRENYESINADNFLIWSVHSNPWFSNDDNVKFA